MSKFWKSKLLRKKTCQPPTGVEMSKLPNPLKTEDSELEDKPDLIISKPGMTNNKVVESTELKILAEKLGLNFTENKDDLKKFYGI